MRVRAPYLTAGFVVCLAVLATAQQTAPPVFRSGVDVVELDVFATDANGDPVNDLTVEDFEVREQGRIQPVSSFTRIDIPIERHEQPLFAGRPIQPDVLSNEGEEGRIYVIAFDVVEPANGLRTRRFLRNFIEQHFGANDAGAVVYLGRASRDDAQELTSNPQLLLRAIDRFAPFPRNENVPLTITNADAPPPPGTDTGPELEARNEQRLAMRSFRDLVEFMATLRGRRKSLLYISQGWLFDVFSVIDYNGGVLGLAAEDAHGALRAATRGNVTIYPIDPSGLTVDGAGGETEAAPEIDRLAALQNKSNLRRLAEVTGGFAFVNQNDFSRAFERIVRENSSYYLLGYSPTDERRDGRYRKLEVRVRRPGVQVRARTGYLAPRTNQRPRPQIVDSESRVSASLRESLGASLPARGIPMRVFAAPYKGRDREATIAVTLETSAAELGLTQNGDSWTGEVEFASTAVDSRNKITPGQFHVAKLTLQATRGTPAERKIRIVDEVRLAPGRYQLRVALGNRAGRSGSVVYDLEVPDFTREPLVMSGVSLMSARTAATALPIQPPDVLKDLLPAAPTATREFATADTVGVYAEVYDNIRSGNGHDVRITAELKAEGGQSVRTVTEERTSKELDGARGGYSFTGDFPLADVAPGRYVIHIEARAETGDRPTVAHDIVITVR